MAPTIIFTIAISEFHSDEVAMPDLIGRLGKDVAFRLRRLGFTAPNRTVVDSLLRVAYMATLKTEEGRFVSGSLTFANPKDPEPDRPFTKRADYPAFTAFGRPCLLSVEQLVKLARAIDRWSGSIAVHASKSGQLYAWGVLDQMVQQNVRLHREAETGFQNPGLLTVTMDGVGDISAFHGDVFLGGSKAQELVLQENDALESAMFFNYGFAAIESFAEPIVRALDDRVSVIDTFYLLFTTWQNTVGRLLIGLRRLGTGGAFLLTPRPYARGIHIGQPFPYSRLKDATILSVLDKAYVRALDEEEGYSIATAGSVQAALAREIHCANTDLDDRRTAVTGAVKLATSLAAVDGLVLMTPSLAVVGFGAKITASRTPQVIYDGADYAKRGTRARTVDPVRYGTRHGSMFRYCAMDPRALGLVMSQDGYARMIMSSGQHLVMWDGMKLLDHENYSSQIVERERRSRKRRAAAPWPYKLGYTRTPKTLQALVMVRRRRRSRSPRVR